MLYRDIIAVLIIIQNSQMRSVGRMKNFLLLNLVALQVTTGI